MTTYFKCNLQSDGYHLDFEITSSTVVNNLHDYLPNVYPLFQPGVVGAKGTLLVGRAGNGTVAIMPYAVGLSQGGSSGDVCL